VKRHELTIEGMTCNHCVMHVQKELSKIVDLVVEDVQIGKAHVRYEEGRIPSQRIVQAVEDAGYKLVASS